MMADDKNEFSHANIVSGGGWLKQQRLVRPKAIAFSILSVGWVIIAIAVLGVFRKKLSNPSAYLEWLCIALLIPEIVLIALALIFWSTETPKIMTTYAPLPDHNARNLH